MCLLRHVGVSIFSCNLVSKNTSNTSFTIIWVHCQTSSTRYLANVYVKPNWDTTKMWEGCPALSLLQFVSMQFLFGWSLDLSDMGCSEWIFKCACYLIGPHNMAETDWTLIHVAGFARSKILIADIANGLWVIQCSIECCFTFRFPSRRLHRCDISGMTITEDT